MTWPTADVSTTHLDAGTDDPSQARADIKDLAEKFNAVRQFRQNAEVDVASASTTTLGGRDSDKIRITGTTTITSFGTNYSGPVFVRFAGALTLTHNATSLILPGGANIAC